MLRKIHFILYQTETMLQGEDMEEVEAGAGTGSVCGWIDPISFLGIGTHGRSPT